MNAKIIISLCVMGVAAVVVVGGTTAYFSDTETSQGNVIQAGSLDLTVNGYNDPNVLPVVEIGDMKPCMKKYSDLITLRVFNNPGRLYKYIDKGDCGADIFCCETGKVTEPECTDQGGVWDDVNDTCIWSGTNGDCNYLPEVIWFDLEVWVGLDEPDPNAPLCDEVAGIVENCWKVLIPDGVVTLDQIGNKWIYLGEYGEPFETNEVTIRQSFHMFESATNEYQGDVCRFAEKFMVLQTNAPHPNPVYEIPPVN